MVLEVCDGPKGQKSFSNEDLVDERRSVTLCFVCSSKDDKDCYQDVLPMAVG